MSESNESAAPTPGDAAAERSRRKKAASKLGWRLIGTNTAEIRVERTHRLGERIITIKGRVTVDAPDEISSDAGERATAPVVDPAFDAYVRSMEKAGTKILSAPDPATDHTTFENPSFFDALDNARRTLVRWFQELENRRLDERIEADLGLRFYLESFRREERALEYFVGPTNSGKTHAALEALRAADDGMYLAPLRLLALEVYERLNEAGTPASLVTGEERIVDAAARHVSSTVEMIDLGRTVDVAVIDEAQMLADEQRGWAWTLAVTAVRAKRVILCGSEDGLVAAQRLCARIGTALAVRRFERKNPLTVVDPIDVNALRKGDAVIAFSRNSVVDLQKEITRRNRTTAAIYGSLSPVVRRREAERFRSGAADVLIATDAIGLGLNLPIRRVVFASVEKFDGTVTRPLLPPEVRQIAGRAGRYGFHEEGQVTAFDVKSVRFLRSALDAKPVPQEERPIWISPTDEHLRRLGDILKTDRISRLLQFFQNRILREDASDIRIADLSAAIEIAVGLEMSDAFSAMPLRIRSTYCRAPISLRGSNVTILMRWADQHGSHNRVDGRELLRDGGGRDRLLAFEDRSRLASVYLWLAQRFPEAYVNVPAVMRVREQTDEDIEDALMRQGEQRRAKKPAAHAPRRLQKGPKPFNKRRLPKK